MKTTGFPTPINDPQSEFRALCEKGGGPQGGPPRGKVQEVLDHAGKKLNELAYSEIADQLAALPGRNPWHICLPWD